MAVPEEEYIRHHRTQDEAEEGQDLKPVTAPRKRDGIQTLARIEVVIGPAPSHDGAPAFAAYPVAMHLRARHLEDINEYSGVPRPTRQRSTGRSFGIRIYDATEDGLCANVLLCSRVASPGANM